ncbi:hypothetical protein [Planktothrix agardhii]|uniref:hypothetical protein n=1 Tax=Planktothrix agardhii TaxID=1160 RepID=UPI000405DC37|nr:hypothetical protein [Planktothrix agardhii]
MVAAIGEIVRNGIAFDLKNWNKGMYSNDQFVQFIENVFDTLTDRNIDYLLVGGVALLSYVEGRNTQEINLILAKSDLKALPEITIVEENNDFIRGEFGNLTIDILLTQNKLFNKLIQEFATIRQFGTKNIRCVSVEGLVILKFYALPSLYRQGKFDRVSIYENDILLLLLNYSVNLEKVLQILANHLLPSDLEELKEISTDIESRIKRFTAQKKKLE